jgi:hypothetical protein
MQMDSWDVGVEKRLTFANRLRDGKSDGTKEFSFSINPGATFIVLSATNLALPPSNWTVVGAPANAAPVMNPYGASTRRQNRCGPFVRESVVLSVAPVAVKALPRFV